MTLLPRSAALRLALATGAALVALANPAAARTILITNDDGLTSNVLALHAALTQAGHDVVVSVPCQNQSGTGAAIAFEAAMVPLSQPCRHDAAQPGDPAAGPITLEGVPQGDFFYVDGTPVMALLHGLDVAAKERWGAMPELVLSGPNEGQNLGAIVISSGTVGAAQAAALQGLPAIALSAGSNTDGPDLANPLSVPIARLSAQLVTALDEAAGDQPLLPRGLALNVNFPDDPTEAEWRLTRLGTYNAYQLGFTMNMARDASPTVRAMAQQRGVELPELPGLTFDFNTAQPTADQMQDESVVYRQHIAVSPMTAGFETTGDALALLAERLSGLMPQSAN